MNTRRDNEPDIINIMQCNASMLLIVDAKYCINTHCYAVNAGGNFGKLRRDATLSNLSPSRNRGNARGSRKAEKSDCVAKKGKCRYARPRFFARRDFHKPKTEMVLIRLY